MQEINALKKIVHVIIAVAVIIIGLRLYDTTGDRVLSFIICMIGLIILIPAGALG